MVRLHNTTLLALLLGSALYSSTSAYRPSLRTRMLQDGASAATAMNSTSASGNSTAGSGDLPACRESFPPGPPAPKASGPRAGTPPPPGPGPAGASPPSGGPGMGNGSASDSSSIFEHSKNEPFFKHRVATLASCLIEEGKCAEAVHKVDALSRALATTTQQLYDKAAHNSSTSNTTSAGAGNGTSSNSSSGSGDASGGSNSSTSSPAKQQPATTPSPITGPSADNGTDSGSNSSASAGGSNSSSKVEPASFAQLLANSTEVKAVLKEKGTCVSSQPGGEEAFMKGYSDFVKEILSNSTSNSTSSMGSGSMGGSNSTAGAADNSTSATSPGAARTIGDNGRRPRFA